MPIDPDKLQIAIQRYLNGETSHHVAYNIGVPEPTLRAAFKRLGISRPHLGHGPKRKLSEEQEQSVAAAYKNGKSAHAISVEIGIPVVTVRRTLDRLSIPRNQEFEKHYLVGKQRRAAAVMCANGASIGQAAEKFGVVPQTITRILRENDVNLPRGRRPCRALDHDAFDVRTPTVLYWMGFLFADGNVCDYEEKASPKVRMNLAVKDRVHMEKFRDLLGSSHKIATRQPGRTSYEGAGPHVAFSVRSKKLYAALKAIGMETKRTRVPIPELVTSRDFWRGMVDGDGWLGTDERAYNTYPCVSLAGQYSLLECYLQFLATLGIKTLNIGPTESGIWKVQAMGSTADKIITALYTDPAEVLDRKNVRAQAIIVGDLRRFPPYVEEPSFIPQIDDDEDE